jgi:hypothetical protein
MVWSCGACTFDNANDAATNCTVCDTPRVGLALTKKNMTTMNARSTTTSTSQQQTLFGTKANEVDLTQKKPASRKRKAPTTTATATSTATAPTTTTVASCASSSLVKNPYASSASVSASTKTIPQHHPFAPTVQNGPCTNQDIQRILTNVFGLQTLRNLQPAVLKCALLQKQSQLVVMATGGGKSLCYQLPACLLGGITIVISPLIALMQDQVQALNAKNIPAACVSSSQTEQQNRDILERVTCRSTTTTTSTPTTTTPLTLLYITPESIQTERMRNVLKQLYKEQRLAMFAVDEAHCLSRYVILIIICAAQAFVLCLPFVLFGLFSLNCIILTIVPTVFPPSFNYQSNYRTSSWGHDFRPAYRKLSWLRTQFPKVLCMACTATATPQVISDIQSILHLQSLARFGQVHSKTTRCLFFLVVLLLRKPTTTLQWNCLCPHTS